MPGQIIKDPSGQVWLREMKIWIPVEAIWRT